MDAPGPVKLRLVCSRANGGGARQQIELAPADHYGVVWTPDFKIPPGEVPRRRAL